MALFFKKILFVGRNFEVVYNVAYVATLKAKIIQYLGKYNKPWDFSMVTTTSNSHVFLC